MTEDKLADLRHPRRFMPVDVFIGGMGDIVLMQEHPDIAGGRYLRIFVHPDDVEDLTARIQAIGQNLHRRGAA